MKQIINLSALIFALFIVTACNSSAKKKSIEKNSIENNSWSGEDVIAGISITFKLETKSDSTYKAIGTGDYEYHSGNYKKISDNEIELTSGEYSGYKCIKEGSTMKIYVDGDYFMTLNSQQ